MPEPKLTRAAEEALRGPFTVEYHDSWVDHYHISGSVPGEDDQENTSDDELGRHDVRRRAIELLPEVPPLVALAHSLMIDASDRGELEGDDETSRKGRDLLAGAAGFFDALNAAAEPHEMEELDAPPEEFRSWLVGYGPVRVGHADDPVCNPFSVFLEERHGGRVRIEHGVVRLHDDGPEPVRKRTPPYLDSFLWVLERTRGSAPVHGASAARVLDDVLAGAHEGLAEPTQL